MTINATKSTQATQADQYTTTPNTESVNQLRFYSTLAPYQKSKFNSRTVKVVVASALTALSASCTMLGIVLTKNDSFPTSNNTLLAIYAAVTVGASVFVGGITSCLSGKCNNEQNIPITNV